MKNHRVYYVSVVDTKEGCVYFKGPAAGMIKAINLQPIPNLCTVIDFEYQNFKVRRVPTGLVRQQRGLMFSPLRRSRRLAAAAGLSTSGQVAVALNLAHATRVSTSYYCKGGEDFIS